MYGIVATWRIRVSEWIGKIRARSGEIGIQILYNRVLTNESSNRHPIINEVDRSQPKSRSLVACAQNRFESNDRELNQSCSIITTKYHLILFEFFRNSVSNLTRSFVIHGILCATTRSFDAIILNRVRSGQERENRFRWDCSLLVDEK